MPWKIWLAVTACLMGGIGAQGEEAAPRSRPLALHPENRHYFLWRGRAAVLVGSGEHYGAVLNSDFDYQKYLATLAECRLNHTRTFTGVYCEPPGAFRIESNTLAPAPGKLLTPWARSPTPGYANGGAKFDLQRWDEAYFRRLKHFVAEAERAGVVVELVLFCPFYKEEMWRLSPLHAANNVNAVGTVGREQVYTLDQHGGLLPYQEALVRKLAAELNEFDNLYFEICNEPYFGGVTQAWQHRLVEVLAEAESKLPRQHLISLNIANGSQRVEKPHPAVSIFNFHYASPPHCVRENFEWQRVIGDNETGFKGNADGPYRREAWEFFLAGGALFSHLDYSFAVGHEGGTFAYGPRTPGGGNREFRIQLGRLKDFLAGFDLVRMRPAPECLKEGAPPQGSAWVLAEAGRQYAAYVFGPSERLVLEVPAGTYTAKWLDPVAGKESAAVEIRHAGGPLPLQAPWAAKEMALAVRTAATP